MSALVEDAIHAELVTASGIAGERIVYEHQHGDALSKSSGGSRELCLVSIQEPHAIAPATPVNTIRDNPSPVAGVEILLGVSEDVEFTVRLSLYSGEASGNGSAYARLRDTVLRLGLDAVTTRLADAGIVFVECRGAVRHVPAVLETNWESRAVADLRFRVVEGVEVPETFIETAEFAATYT